jgi:hydrogenase nickel incorporation protein HypA/HybF
MHEKSLVQALLRQVRLLMTEHQATSVDTITVETGLLSGVETELVRSAFEELLPAQELGQPVLQVQEIGLVIQCRQCSQQSSVHSITLQCPLCASSAVQIVRGDEFRLIDVSMQVPVSADPQPYRNDP